MNDAPQQWALLPSDLGAIHFIGIGGIGMSGIAEILLTYGCQVQGSDLNKSAISDRLARMGATIFTGHDAANVARCDVVIVSTAISDSNVELRAARERGIPVVRRAEMLAELMRLKSNIAIAGTHGKTTTTTIVAALLDHSSFDPTVINGGVIHAYGSNARAGKGKWMVVEADESDGTFNRLPATIALVTNIDPEHMDHWKSEEALHQGFYDFLSNIPFYGLAVCCTDDPTLRAMTNRITDRRVVSFGFNDAADVRGVNLKYIDGQCNFDIALQQEGLVIKDCTLPMPGAHNVSNTLGAVAVARHLGIDAAQIREALAAFGGVSRRFTKLGEVDGVILIDDYAHHPVEIAAVLNAARNVTEGRIIAIHQPHRYSRLSTHFDDFCRCFDDADVVCIADVYPAGEEPIDGISGAALVEGLTSHGHGAAYPLSTEGDMIDLIRAHARPGDMVVCMGAGSIGSWVQDLPAKLTAKGL